LTKRTGLFDVGIDVRGLLDDINVSGPAASKSKRIQHNANDDSKMITDTLDMITRQMKVSHNRSRTISDYVLHFMHSKWKRHTKYQLQEMKYGKAKIKLIVLYRSMSMDL